WEPGWCTQPVSAIVAPVHTLSLFIALKGCGRFAIQPSLLVRKWAKAVAVLCGLAISTLGQLVYGSWRLNRVDMPMRRNSSAGVGATASACQWRPMHWVFHAGKLPIMQAARKLFPVTFCLPARAGRLSTMTPRESHIDHAVSSC